MFQLIMTHRPTAALVLVAFFVGMSVNDIANNGWHGWLEHLGLDK
jgi:hypothetical protein